MDQEDFDRLLAWLNPDRDLAARKYEEIRASLIKFFIRRGCLVAEELTDVTIDRVANKVREIEKSYVGDPALYFYGVARNVFLEHVRKKPVPLPPPTPDAPEEKELKYNCLDSCMSRLDSASRKLISEYFGESKRAKIDHRRMLAEQLGIEISTLRMRAHRIKLNLQQCVTKCLKRSELH